MTIEPNYHFESPAAIVRTLDSKGEFATEHKLVKDSKGSLVNTEVKALKDQKRVNGTQLATKKSRFTKETPNKPKPYWVSVDDFFATTPLIDMGVMRRDGSYKDHLN